MNAGMLIQDCVSLGLRELFRQAPRPSSIKPVGLGLGLRV